MFLLKHTIRWAITLSHQYTIKNWYGVGTTPAGQNILEQLGFREIVSLEKGERKGYILDKLSSSKTLQRFSEGIEHQDLLLSDQRHQTTTEAMSEAPHQPA